MSTLWCNGEWLDAARFAPGARDRGWTLGLGLFETMLAVRGRVVFGERHLARLAAGCERLGWPVPWGDAPGLLEVAARLVAREGLGECNARVRLSLSAGSGPLADLGAGGDRLLWMAAAPLGPVPAGLAVAMSPWRRNEHGALAGLKCASYAENLVALDHARRAGFDEALFLNTAGNVCEAATANIFLLRDGVLRTPSLDSGCLPGVARAVMLEMARAAELPCAEGTLTTADLAAAEGIFLTSSTRGPVPVVRLEGRQLGATPLTDRLRGWWRERVEAPAAS